MNKRATSSGGEENEPRSTGSLTLKQYFTYYNIDVRFCMKLLSAEEYDDCQIIRTLMDRLLKEKKHNFKKAFRLWTCIQANDDRVVFNKLTLFHLVCLMKETKLVKKYLEMGVDANQSIGAHYTGEYAGCSPLHLALSQLKISQAYGDELKTVKILLQCDADANSVNSYGNRPIHILLSRGRFSRRLFKLLMSYGAKDNATNDHGQTPFEILLNRSSTLDIERYVKSHGTVNHFNSIDRTGCMATMLMFRRINAKLIATASDIMRVDKKGRTAIHNLVSFDISQHDEDLIDFLYDDLQNLITHLMRRGININSQDDSGKTALHYAVDFCNKRTVSILLAVGADTNVANVTGLTALNSAKLALSAIN